MELPKEVADAVLVKTATQIDLSSKPSVSGYDFNEGINYHALLESYKRTGYQATNFGLAVEQINTMVSFINCSSFEINDVVILFSY